MIGNGSWQVFISTKGSVKCHVVAHASDSSPGGGTIGPGQPRLLSEMLSQK